MTQLVFDEETAARIEAVYHAGDAVRRRALVRTALAAAPGERIVDVGCGPGFYCRELADEVEPSGSVVGVDSSPPMLALAARRCAEQPNVSLTESEATLLPLEAGSADAAICVQVLEYVEDVSAVLDEMHRVLRPGGRVVVWAIDWATVWWHSRDEARTERVLRAWDEHLAHRSLPRTLAPMVRGAGFEDVEAEAHAFATIELDPDRYGVALIPIVEGFVAGRRGVTTEEAGAWAVEQRELGERGELYFTSTQFCFTARKPA